jgi:hypothetical protein
MFSKLIKLTFAITAYAPVILIWWLVSVYSILNSGGTIGFINFSDFKFSDLFNRLNLILIPKVTKMFKVHYLSRRIFLIQLGPKIG